MYYLFAQSTYGEGNYGSDVYAGQTSTGTGSGTPGLVDTGSPVFWGSLIGLAIIIAVILTAISASRRNKKK